MRLPRLDYEQATFQIGRFDRAPIEVHASFFIVAFALTMHFWRSFTLQGLGLTLIGIPVIFGSVLMHELAHAVVARHYKIPVHGILIHIFGGTVEFGWRPSRAARDIALTFAGPASNLVLAALLGIALTFVLEPHMVKSGCEMVEEGFEAPTDLLGRALVFAMFFNLGMGLINLLPAFPLDGGWISYRLLTHRFGPRIAGITVASLGIVLAALSTLVFVVSMFTGYAIYAPPDFRSNLDAFHAARRGDPVELWGASS